MATLEWMPVPGDSLTGPGRVPVRGALRERRTRGPRLRAYLCCLLGAIVAHPAAAQSGAWDDDLFRSQLAAPREVASYFSVLSWDTPHLDTRVASMGIGDAFPLAHWGREEALRGRLAIEFAVLAQFDLDGPSFDFVNADFFVGIPVSLRHGDLALRGRFYHWSAHLGDEFLLSSGLEREEISVEALELLVSRDLGSLRLIGGGITRLRRFPKDLSTRIIRGGAELNPARALLDAGPLGTVRAVAAADLRLTDVEGWSGGFGAKLGLRFSPGDAPRDGPGGGPGDGPEDLGANRRRSWSLMLEFFDGPSPYGQFFRTDLRTLGVGLRLH